jgi:hypothetical protein
MPIKKNTFKLNISDCKILKISNNSDFENFEKKYSDNLGLGFIKWDEVAKNYDGIEIADESGKYLDDKKWSSKWYYSWDVGSGCIWNKCKVTFEKI